MHLGRLVQKNKYSLNATQELRGLGLANLAGAAFNWWVHCDRHHALHVCSGGWLELIFCCCMHLCNRYVIAAVPLQLHHHRFLLAIGRQQLCWVSCAA
jgi:hypothetical protein